MSIDPFSDVRDKQVGQMIVESLLADEKDGGYDLTAGLFGAAFSALVRRWAAAEWKLATPIDMLLYCPNCGVQHIDKPDLCETCPGGNCMCVMQAERWTNPPHRSHLCASCGCIWRPADMPTNGVEAIKSQGKADTWPVPHNEEVRAALAAPTGMQLVPMQCTPEIEATLKEVAKKWFAPSVWQSLLDAARRSKA